MEWFRHDSNANLDEKLQEVLLDYGLEGYGLYWYCIELIVGKTSADNITFELKHDARIIARNTGSTAQRVEEMMKRFISVGLFENNDGKITCLKVAKRLMSSATSNPKMRDMIQDIRHSHDGVMTKSDNVMQEEKRLEEKRLEEKRLEEKQRKLLRTKVLYEEFDEFWKSYPKKTGKDKALASWKTKNPKLEEVLFALSWQKESDQWIREDGQFIPNPTTYLNQGRWKDEPPVDASPF